MNAVRPPPSVLASLPGTLVVLADALRTSLYLREDSWNLRNYPRDCAVELRLGRWDINAVLTAALVARFAHSDALTFDRLLDMSLPENVRLLQFLSRQTQLEVHLATDVVARTFRVPNLVRARAARIVHDLRLRPAWSEAQYQQASQRLTQLYPTSDRLWWACEESSE